MEKCPVFCARRKTKSPRGYRGQNGGFGFGKRALSAAAIAVTAGIAGVAGITIIAAVAVRCACYIAGNAVRGTEYGAKAAAGFRCGGGGEHIHRETDIFKIRAGISRTADSRAAFRQASAKGIDHHIYGAVQLHNAEQTQRYIDCYGCAHCRIAASATAAIVAAGVASAATSAVARAAGRVSQVCRQRDCFAFRDNERPAAGIAAAIIQIGRCGDFGFCGAKQRYVHIVCVCSVDTADCTPIRRQGIILG